MQQYQELSFGQVLSIEIAKIGDNKNMFGTKALILILISLMSFSLKQEQNQGYEYFINFLSIFTRPPYILFIPICILMLILYFFFYGCLLLISYLQYQSQNKITMSKNNFKRLHILMLLGIECAVWLSCPILSINLGMFNKQSSSWSTIPIINIFLHSIIVLSYFYFYRLYRTFNLASYCYYLIVIFIVAIDWNTKLQIQPYILWLLSIFKLIDIILFLPYKITFENKIYKFGSTGLFIVSLLEFINGDNIFETLLLAFPIFFYLFKQLQGWKWKNLILYMRSGSMKQMDIKKMCSSLEALVWYIEQARMDSYIFMLSLFVLKYHTQNCNDSNCECKEDLSRSNTQNGESMTHRSSFQSKTALLSNGDKNSNQYNISQNLDVSQFQNTIKDGSHKNDSFVGGVHPQYEQQTLRPSKAILFQPMKFIQNNIINEDLISQYVKIQFHQTIQQLSFSLHLDEVEYLSLKYISFMFSFKKNSLSSLTKLKQIQSRTIQFSYFFQNVTKVTESQFIDALKLKHFDDKNTYDDLVKMNVTEISRLEMVKDDFVKSIVSVLRKKITLWENLCSGDIQNMNRFLEDIIKILLQIEQIDMLGYENYEDMIQNLRIRGLQSFHQSQNLDKLQISSIMPPYLTASHNYFISRFIHRGYTYYYDKPINSYACDAQGFVFPININLSFNFQNLSDFTLLGSILKIKDDDEWRLILGFSMHTFNKLILKGALDEFGMVQYKSINQKLEKLGHLKNAILHKIAKDDNAKLFKKTNTMHQKQNTSKSQIKRTYQKQSDILLQFGNIQHFLPLIGKSITDLLSKDIFKKLQKESQEQFNKLTDNQKAQDFQQQNNNKFFEKQASNLFQRQISQFIDRQQSLNQGGLSSSMLDKDQYRNDERLVLYVPRNYNELIEYFNDAGERLMESKNDMETKSIRRQQMQNKYSYIKQQQNCYHLFDTEFQDFIDNKVRKYYSKALLKEALESHDFKLLQQVRYKCVSSIDVGVGGVSDKDQFLYFVCKLSSLNLQKAKRKDVLKIHMKKEKNQQFDGGEELRKSLIQQVSSMDSFDKEKPKRSLSIQESFGPSQQQQIKYKGQIDQPIIVTLAIPDNRTYLSSLNRDDGPNMKVNFEAENQKLNESSFDII